MHSAKHKPGYLLNDKGEFVITDYNYSKPLSNFFPGIAGSRGIPMWVFYVNRGQAISSFGTDGKDSAILEFQPANKAWQTTSLQGFRTFIKVTKGGNKESFYEPFSNGLANQGYKTTNSLSMSSCDLTLSERNASLGLELTVKYFCIPQDSFAALARVVSIRNTGRSKLRLRVLDGLPQVVPYGENNFCLKKMSRTIEAWMRVENLDKGVPVYKLAVDPGDRPQVVHIEKGNFYLGFTLNGKKAKIIKPVVDPDCIFGPSGDFTVPRNFFDPSWKYPASQQTESKTPCGFLNLDMELAAGEEQSFNAVIGTVRSTGLLGDVVARVTAPGYLEAKAAENKRIIGQLTGRCATASASSTYDLYCGQTFLDNALRGGSPLVFSDGDVSRVFYLYSRKHGDPERDYNRFQIQDTYFSQGNGNYRDINQNRRCDVWFNPAVRDFNIRLFVNLIQSDGYNPLVVKGSRFILDSRDEFLRRFSGVINSRQCELLLPLLEKPFTPGELAFFIEEHAVELPESLDRFLEMLLPLCRESNEAEHGEGYWIDHWHYNLDLLENYLSLYPESRGALLLDRKTFTFFDNDAVVQPRSAKYVLLDGKPRQLHSVIHDAQKRDLIRARRSDKHAARTQYGNGDVFRVTLLSKLLCVFVNKFASLDPFGVGIEMEADKPNWYDALNGLPALFGSSACETFELKRLARFLSEGLKPSGGDSADIPEEIASFFSALVVSTVEAEDPLAFWRKSGALKEEYRAKTRMGFSGAEMKLSISAIIDGLAKAQSRIEAGIKAAYDKSQGVYNSYFINEVISFERLPGNEIMPRGFKQIALPFFLEGQVHALRTCDDRPLAGKLYSAVRKSALYDSRLRMYKVNAPLGSMSEDIGRCRVFTPGWLENESVFLHMEYKYLLELLKQGLYEEFFADFKNALIPFQKAEVYGRSVLENSSFLVSSAFPCRNLHGNGFVARLSGSTAEFVQMWLIMNAGSHPFSLDEKGKLLLTLSPILPGWLFRKKDKKFSFRFLGKTDVTYINPSLRNTFGPDAVRVRKVTLTDLAGVSTVIDSAAIPAPLADKVRSGEISAITAELG